MQFSKPRLQRRWIPFVLISVWLLFHAFCVYQGICDGDEGMVFTCLVAGAILLICLSLDEMENAAGPGTRDTEIA